MRFWKAKEPKSFWVRARYGEILHAYRATGKIDHIKKIAYHRRKTTFTFEYMAIDLESGRVFARVYWLGAESSGWKQLKVKARKNKKELKEFRDSPDYRKCCWEFSALINQTVAIENEMLEEVKKGRKKHG